MKVLVVGGGGREHALVWKIAQSSPRPEIVERLRQMGSFPVHVHTHENGFGR